MSHEERIARLCAFIASLPAPRRPPLVLPPELGVQPEDVFRHLDPRAVPEIASTLEYLMEHHPQVLAAIGDVDRTLIWSAMERTPLENLAEAGQMARTLEHLAGARSDKAA